MRIAVAGGTGTAGRYVVEAGEAAGHQMVVIGRSRGIDLADAGCEEALAAALDGVQAVVDTSNTTARSRDVASAFFEGVAGRLQRVGAERGVARLVTLSIVGIDRVPGLGYYEAKVRHEEVSLAGPLPATVVRATQFHEFPGQILRVARRGPVALVPVMRTQPIAARSVGQFLLDTATTDDPTGGGTLEIAGPEPADLVDLARTYLRHRGTRALVVPLPLPGRAAGAMRRGACLPTDDVPRLGPTFSAWLRTADAAP